ncbi:MAG: sigma-70 family RNA polymerase sigma factor [Planctomycetota bacterium]
MSDSKPEPEPAHDPTRPRPGADNPVNSTHDAELRSAVDRYHRPLVAYARNLLGDPERARDVAQDTLLRLCQQTERDYRDKIMDRQSAWLFTVCRNRAFDILRKERRMNSTDALLFDQQAASGAEAASPAALAEQADDRHALLALVAALPGPQREVVQLRFQGGLTYAQIGEVTGQSTSYVGVLLHQAMGLLREQMKKITA